MQAVSDTFNTVHLLVRKILMFHVELWEEELSLQIELIYFKQFGYERVWPKDRHYNTINAIALLLALNMREHFPYSG